MMPGPRPTATATSTPFAARGSGVLTAVALAFVAVYVAIAVARMGYPYELEWIEGGLLQATGRLLEGAPLYTRPSVDYVAFNYPPLYPWVAALMSRVVGEGFFALRLTSFLASIVSLALVGGWVWRETGRALPAMLATGLLAATYRLGGAWFDVARADSLYLMLLLAGLAVLRFDRSRLRSPVAAGVLLALAFLAKQSAAMVVLPLLGYLAWTDRPRAMVLAATMALLGGGATAWLDVAHDGWYRYFMFSVPVQHPVDPRRILEFWPRDIVLPLGLAILIAAAGAMLRRVRAEDSRSPASPAATPTGFHLAMFAGAGLSSWFHRMYPGGYDNVLMPAYAVIAILFGIGWERVSRWISSLQEVDRGRMAGVMALAVLLQFGTLAYDPRAQIPRPADRVAGDRLVERLRVTPGRVLVPSHPYLARRAGKPDHFHEMALIAVIEYADGEVERRLKQELGQAFRDTAFTAVVVSTRGWLGDVTRPVYEPAFQIFTGQDVFWPVTGMRTRPEAVLVPRGRAPGNTVTPVRPAG